MYIRELTKEYTFISVSRNITVIFQYIHRLGVTKEYTFIFLGTDEYNDIYSSILYSSVPSSVMKVCPLVIIDECVCVSYNIL
jgi:hypothetical protein